MNADELESAYQKWQAENPDKKVYEFGFDFESVPCKANPRTSHIGPRNRVACDCAFDRQKAMQEALDRFELFANDARNLGLGLRFPVPLGATGDEFRLAIISRWPKLHAILRVDGRCVELPRGF
jgi:hypothetical protein